MLHDLTSVLNIEEMQNEYKCKIELDLSKGWRTRGDLGQRREGVICAG